MMMMPLFYVQRSLGVPPKPAPISPQNFSAPSLFIYLFASCFVYHILFCQANNSTRINSLLLTPQITMKRPTATCLASLVTALALCVPQSALAFVPQAGTIAAGSQSPLLTPFSSTLRSTAEEAGTESKAEAGSDAHTKTAELGLVTFDLDDTLYPVTVVIEEAVSANLCILDDLQCTIFIIMSQHFSCLTFSSHVPPRYELRTMHLPMPCTSSAMMASSRVISTRRGSKFAKRWPRPTQRKPPPSPTPNFVCWPSAGRWNPFVSSGVWRRLPRIGPRQLAI